MNEPELASQPTVPPESSSELPEGVAIESPFTRPFEGFTYLRKEWLDQEDDIEKVTLNITLSHLNRPADWAQTEVFTLMPQWGTAPLKRTWIVRLPTHYDQKEKYLFHYFFQIYYNNGSDRISNTFTHLMAPQHFEFLDHSGEMLFVQLHWSIGNWLYPQDTDLEVDGIEWGSESSVSRAPYRNNDKLYQSGRFLLLRRLPVPRRFSGFICVPKGSEVKYCFHLSRHTPDGLESLWDNNFGKNYSLTF